MGRSYKTDPSQKSFMDPSNTPAVMMVETLERTVFEAEFDDCELALKITPGQNKVNAVITGFKDPIRDHDIKVLEVEEMIEVFFEKNKIYKRELRTVKNWETGWQLLNSRPQDLEKYLELKESMRDFESRLEKVKNPEVYSELQDEYREFKELQGRCERLLEARKMVDRCKEDLDEALKVMLNASKDLEKARAKEEELAELISDDHVEADKRGIRMEDLFPLVKTGMVIVRIHHVDTEELEFDEIMKQMRKAKRPHKIAFRRYDYLQDMLSGEWQSLQELRQLGRFVQDPRVLRYHFVEAGRRGNLDDLQMGLRRGEDVNATDVTMCTALHHASANGHIPVMELLLKHGADLEKRDNNMETPLLHAARKGNIKSVHWLVEKGASLGAKDKNHRTAVFHAIMSGHVDMVAELIQIRTALSICDRSWKWTPLHYAAHGNYVEMVEMLLSRRASPYLESEKGWTPLQVARNNKANECAEILAEFVFSEPAQNAIRGVPKTLCPKNIWVGCHRAADVRWATDRGFQAILSIYKPGDRDPKHLWLTTLIQDKAQNSAGSDDGSEKSFKDDITWISFEVDIDDEDKTSSSWERLSPQLPKMLSFINKSVAEGRELLIHCENGVSTSPALVLMYGLIKRRIRLDEGLKSLMAKRKEVKLSRSLYAGLASLEAELDLRKMDRLDARLRDSAVMSIGF